MYAVSVGRLIAVLVCGMGLWGLCGCPKPLDRLEDPLSSKQNSMSAIQKYWNAKDYKKLRLAVDPERREVFDGYHLDMENQMLEYMLTGYRANPDCCEEGPDFTGFIVTLIGTGDGRVKAGEKIEMPILLRLIDGQWMLWSF